MHRQLLLYLASSERPSLSWDKALLNLARRHGLTPLLYKRVKESKSRNEIPKWFLNELKKDYLYSFATYTYQTKTLKQVLQAFREAQIPLMILKGLVLGQAVYENGILRPAVDIDILVDEKYLDKAKKILFTLGYKPTFEEPRPGFIKRFRDEITLISPEGVPLDLHWRLIGPLYYYNLALSRIWQKCVKLQINGMTVRTPSIEHTIIYLCLHYFKHKGISLRHFLDIYLLIKNQKIDWTVFLEEVKWFHVERPVYLLFNEILKINQNLIPWFVLNTLKSYKPKRWEDKVIKGDLSYIRQKFCFLSTFPGFKRKIQYLYSVIFPQKTFLIQEHGSPSQMARFIYFAKKIWSNKMD